MPAIAAHYYFGRSVLNHLPSDVRHPSSFPMPEDLTTLFDKAFSWGCQGPDILFYHLFPTGRAENFGHILHREKISQAFFYLTYTIGHLRSAYEFHLLTAYLAGYICHYCLDRQTHPYINDRCRQVTMPDRPLSSQIQHRLLEADLDRAYIQKYAPDIPVRCFRLDQLHDPAPDVIYPIARLLTGLGKNLFAIHTTPARVQESMRMMNHLQTVLYDPNRRKRKSYFYLEKLAGYPDFFTALIPPEVPLGVDVLNETRQPWRDTAGILQSDTFLELEQRARRDAVACITELTALVRGDTAPFPLAFFNRDYTGNFIKKGQKKT